GQRAVHQAVFLRAAVGAVAQAQGHVVAHVEPREQQRLLEDDAHVSPVLAGRDLYRAFVQLIEAGDDAEQRALAAPAGAEEDHALAVLDLQVQVLEDRELLSTGAEATGAAGYAERASSHVSCTSVGACTGRNAASRSRR